MRMEIHFPELRGDTPTSAEYTGMVLILFKKPDNDHSYKMVSSLTTRAKRIISLIEGLTVAS